MNRHHQHQQQKREAINREEPPSNKVNSLNDYRPLTLLTSGLCRANADSLIIVYTHYSIKLHFSNINTRTHTQGDINIYIYIIYTHMNVSNKCILYAHTHIYRPI